MNWSDLWEREHLIETATTITFERLRQLVQKGFQPHWVEGADYIELHHPSKSFANNEVTLFASGRVVAGNTSALRFERDEERQFGQFLRQVPLPTFWDQTRRFRTNVAAWAMIAAWIGACWLIVHMLGFR